MPKLTTEKSLFMTVRNDIAAKILSGVYPVGSQLPGVVEMTRYYRVGYCTVTKAVQALRAEGLLHCRRGRNPEVRAVAGSRKRIIGILVDNGRPDLPPFDYENSPTVWLLVNKLQVEALKRHWPTVLLAPDRSFVNYLHELAGLIAIRSVTGPRLIQSPLALPMTAIYRDGDPETPEANSVASPVEAGMHQALTYLLVHGVKQVFMAYIAGVQTESSFKVASCRNYLFEHDLSPDAVLPVAADNLFTLDGERCFEEKIRQSARPPFGVIAGGDLVARGILQAGIRAGLAPKKDFYVVGSSGLPDAEKWSPPLTTLMPNFEQLADQAITMLEKQIELPGLQLPPAMAPYKLVIRGT